VIHWQYVELHDDYGAEQLAQDQNMSTLWQQLQQLPTLSELQLHEEGAAPADIAPLSNLQGLQRLKLQLRFASGKTESGPTELLAALQHLTQLQHLQLDSCQLHKTRPQPQRRGVGYQCFSALTASTQLTALVLTDVPPLHKAPPNWRLRHVPAEAFAAMFPLGRLLPDLKELCLQAAFPHCVEAMLDPEAQVSRIAASCPAAVELVELSLLCVMSKGFDGSCLCQLPSSVTRVEGLCWFQQNEQ
jgi:hypothetical protein